MKYLRCEGVFRSLVFFFLAVTSVQGSPAAAAKTIVLLQPDLTERADAQMAVPESAEAYIKRKAQVVFTARDQFSRQSTPQGSGAAVQESFRGTDLVLAFFPDEDMHIRVDSESVSAGGVLSLGGRLEASDNSTFSMTVTEDSYLITYQDMDSGMTYKVVGDMTTGFGRVTEFDMALLPPVYDSEPIILPGE